MYILLALFSHKSILRSTKYLITLYSFKILEIENTKFFEANEKFAWADVLNRERTCYFEKK